MRHVAAVFKPLYKLLYCVLVIILKCHNYSNCLYIKQLWAKKKKKKEIRTTLPKYSGILTHMNFADFWGVNRSPVIR